MTIQISKHFEHTTAHLLPRIVRSLAVGYDWLTGPAMTDQERVNHELAATEPLRNLSNISF
ncbi:MAG TPA: hypothetical protein VFR55_00375 [Dehalococcoidia bacterium]|nr:hypothetical protein [Dehalococcoidia bacterium]